MFAIIDLETTGGSNRWGRITEVAIFIFNGREVVDSFSSLINPGMPIPPYITQLTGISNEMVAEAPAFQDVANTIQSITEGCIFVAHNASFDYNFLRQEFIRLGQQYERPNLCTVRLSRKLLPGHASYSLGRLCEALEIPLEGRHRAGGDAAATVKLFDLMLRTSPEEAWLPFVQPAQGLPSPLNKYLTSTTLEDIPTTPGVLYLLDSAEQVMYVEGARHLLKRAKAILNNKGGRRLLNVRNQLSDIRFEETGNLLMAQLKAAEAAVALRPVYNKLPKEVKAPSGWNLVLQPDLAGLLQLTVEKSSHYPPQFSSKKRAQATLGQLRENYFLKPGLPTQLGTADAYNLRAKSALATLPSPPASCLYILRGRQPNEFCLLRTAGLQAHYGYILTEGAFREDELLAACTKTIQHPQAMVLVHKHLSRERVIRTFPIAHAEKEEFISGV